MSKSRNFRRKFQEFQREGGASKISLRSPSLQGFPVWTPGLPALMVSAARYSNAEKHPNLIKYFKYRYFKYR